MGDLLVHVRVGRLKVSQSAPPDFLHVVLASFPFAEHVEQVVGVRAKAIHPALLLVSIFPVLNVLLKHWNQDRLEDVCKKIIKLAPFRPAFRRSRSLSRCRGTRPRG